MSAIKQGFVSGKQRLDLQNFKTFSPQKKFFFFSAGLLLLALIINLIVSINLRNNKRTQDEFSSRLEQAQEKISDAESSLLYKDELSAKNFLAEAQNTIPSQTEKLSGQLLKNYKTTLEKFEEIKQKLEKTVTVQTQSISSLGQSQNLIILPNQIATQINGQILSYNIETGQLKDGELKVDEEIKAQVSLGSNTSVIFNGQGLMVWQQEEGTTGPKFYQNVPGENEFVGLAKYAPNSRVYAVNKQTGQIISFLVVGNQLAKPVIAAVSQAQDLKTAQDIAIDGNIFVLSESSGITKYYAGRLAEFKEPTLITPLSGKGKIYTESDFEYLYVMDAGNNRIVILSASGDVVQTLTSPEFTDLKDFYVDEANRTIYILNDTALLKVMMP